MGEPIVFISRSKIKEGKLEELRQLSKEVLAMIEASKPGTVFQNAYFNESTSEVTFVHIFPDADAMDQHMLGVDERVNKSAEFMQPMSMEIFGSPGEKTNQMFNQIETKGVSLTYWPLYVGGFIRLGA